MIMEQLTIAVSQSEIAPEVAIVAFSGSMNMASIGAISEVFRSVITKSTVYVIADMHEVVSISSAALGELMGGRKVLVDHGGDLMLTRLNMNLKTKLTLMGANKIFKFYSDNRSAVSAFQWEFQGKPEEVTLSFPPFLKFVPAVRQLASRIARQKGYNRRDSFRIETIVDEICNNAVEHGKTDSGENVQLTVVIDRKKIEIKVVNSSNPEKVKHLKSFVEAKELTGETSPDQVRGRGLALIKLLSSELDIDFSAQGTSVRATKIREE